MARVIDDRLCADQWWSDEEPATITQPVTEVMILEGVSALRREFRQFLSIGIFIEVTRQASVARGVARDLATGRPKEELERLWKEWADGEDAYFARDDPRAVADIVLDGTRPFADQLDLC